MTIGKRKMNETLLDVLKEIGNIGSGNAATALAKIINKKIDMNVPKIKILDLKEVANVLGPEEDAVVAVYFEMSGDIHGSIMLVFTLHSAENLVNILFNRQENNHRLDDMDLSALSEIGNILSASYINSLSSLTSLQLKTSVPSINIDMAGALLSVPAVQFGQVGESVLFIETEFKENEKSITGDMFLIPDVESFEKILNCLGIEPWEI